MSTKRLIVRGHQCFGKAAHMSITAENRQRGEKIRRAREAADMSRKDLADAIGAASPTTIEAIENGGNTKYLPRIATVLRLPLRELDSSVDIQAPVIMSGVDLFGPRDLKLYGSIEAGEGALVVSSEPVEWIERPALLATVRDAYGVIVAGESMVPALRPGEIVLVHPYLQPRIEDLCLFINDEHGEFRALVKEYRGQTAEFWKVARYKPKETEFTLKKRDWPKVHVVVGKYSRR